MENIRVVVVGSCNVDFQSFAPRLPKPGETLHGTHFAMGYGGKGANQCIAAAKLGGTTAMVARVGDDMFGENFVRVFKENGVNVDHVHVTKGHSTGIAQIIVADNGENNIVIVVGANNQLSAGDVDNAKELIKKAEAVVFQFETPVETTVHTLKLMKESQGISIVNGAPALANPDPDIFKYSDIFCVNEVEAELMTGVHISGVNDAGKAAEDLLKKGCNMVVITLGENGAIFASQKDPRVQHVKAPAEQSPVDTTGAGDAFVGALAYFLAYCPHLSMRDSIERSCKIASMSVLKPGTQSSFPFRKDLPEEFFQ